MSHRHFTKPGVWMLSAVFLLLGCESPSGLRMPQFLTAAHEKDELHEEAIQRTEFQKSRSKKAMRWLLAHRVQPGMSPTAVGEVLGEEGEREYNANSLKGTSGTYRTDDVLYHFGPDNQGNAVFLAFRDDRLVNFDPDEFKDKGKPTRQKNNANETD